MKGADQAVPDKQDIFPEIQQIEEGVKFLTQATEEIANGATIENSVDRFPVSARWKNRFHIMESAGIRELGFWAFWKNLKKSVPYRKRLSINVPFPEVFFAALFGPLVYFYFKMPKKAILLITAQAIFGLLINVPFIMTGHVLPSGVSIGLNISFVVCTLSYDYYMKNYKGEEVWRFLPSIFSSYWFLVSLMLGSISAILALFVFIL